MTDQIADQPCIEVVTSDLRALLFWAAIGMENSRGGSYESDLEDILSSYAEYIGLKFDRRPQWGARLSNRPSGSKR